MIKIKHNRYFNALENYCGWCSNCEDFTKEAVEPDVEKYKCPQCDLYTVFGAEQALLMGLIEIR